MVKNNQVKGLFKSMSEGKTLSKAAMSADMCENTARRYVCLNKLPSDLKKPREYRTHKDLFLDVWPEVIDFLETNHALEAKVLFKYLMLKYPLKEYQDGQLRAFQRKVKNWKAEFGHFKEAYFEQEHFPGNLCQSDYTSMNKLGITIQRQPFPHLLYHFVLTYSNWESADICFSESFESLSSGLQNAFFRLGAVARHHQTDGLSAAVNNLTEKRDFTQKYSGLLSHYKISGMKTNPASPNENGDIEQANNRLKKAIDQKLMLRGNRDFTDRESYNAFVQQVVKEVNTGCQKKLNEELKVMHGLPDKRLESCTRYSNIRVSKYSTIRVLHNTYSVHSRLIKEQVTVLSYSEHLEVWHSNKCLEKLPRLRGEYRHFINYRHIIDSLVRKPGAFENYKYRSDLFPSTHFRIIYDTLLKQNPSKASSIYLKILYHAAYNNENYVDRALKVIIDENLIVSVDVVKKISLSFSESEKYEELQIVPPDLSDYDSLIGEESAS